MHAHKYPLRTNLYCSKCILVVNNMVRNVNAQRENATGGDLARNLLDSAVLTSLTNTFRFAGPQIPAKVDESTTIGRLVEARHSKVTDSVRADGELSVVHFSFLPISSQLQCPLNTTNMDPVRSSTSISTDFH